MTKKADRPQATLTELEAQRRDLEQRITAEDAKPDGKAGPLIRERRLVTGSIARLRGEGQRVNERVILRSPGWRRIESVCVETLSPWPEACAALVKALRELEGRSE